MTDSEYPFYFVPNLNLLAALFVATAAVSKRFSPVRPLLSEDVANRPQVLVIEQSEGGR
jgi:hypothetical protein